MSTPNKEEVLAYLRSVIADIEAADVKVLDMNHEAGYNRVEATGGYVNWRLDGWRTLCIKWLV